MDAEERPGFLKLEKLSPAAEQVAKYGTAIVLIALGAAFFYDFVFWQFLDARMLTYFVLADHIETAGFIFVGLVIALAAATTVGALVQYAFAHWTANSEEEKRKILARVVAFYWRLRFWLLPLAVVGLVAAAWLSSSRGYSRHPDSIDIVALEKEAELRGKVIRFVDRGLFLRDQRDGRIIFIPKERISRIEHDVPKGERQ